MEVSNSMDNRIKALMDLEHQVPAQMLYEFSDLDAKEQADLAKVWLDIPLQRRQTFMQDLVSLADNDDMLMFEGVARIALEDEDSDVLVSAIDLLFETEDCRLAPVYLRLLADQSRSEHVRAAVANVLGPWVYLGEIEKIRADLHNKIEENLLKSYHEDSSDLVRRRALEALGYSARPEIPPLLRKAASANDELWLESAMFAMGRSADGQWEEQILENLEHENLAVRIQAVHAAGELALAKARKRLLKGIDLVQDETLRHEIIWALASIGGEGIQRKLENLMQKADDDEEAAFIDEALELLNFTEGSEELEMFAVPWQEESKDDLHHHEADEIEDEDDDYLLDQDFDEEEWEVYVDDDDIEEDDEDDYTVGDFDEDRF